MCAVRREPDWLFLGPASTMFSARGARRAVRGLDPALPHFLTGALAGASGTNK